MSQLSEIELDEVLEEKKQIFERNRAKNQRVQALLTRKITQKQEILHDLQNKIDEKLSETPELKYLLNSHDANENPEELSGTITSNKNMVMELESKKIILDREATSLKKTVEILNSRQNALQEDIEVQKRVIKSLSTSDLDRDEGVYLTQISQEYDEINEKMKILDADIEKLKKQIYGSS
ncbi:MAG: hypothetical protein ACFFFG_09120 [Candidatus Thorarchaeota archaeon]